MFVSQCIYKQICELTVDLSIFIINLRINRALFLVIIIYQKKLFAVYIYLSIEIIVLNWKMSLRNTNPKTKKPAFF